LVSTRTLFAAGLAIIAIVTLASVVVVQQIALQNFSKQSLTSTTPIPPVGESLTQITATTTASGYPPSCLNFGFPCVIIPYHGWIYSSFGSCNPKPGYVFLILMVSFWNNGYDTAPTGPHSGLNYGYYFHLAVDDGQYDPIYLSCMNSNDRLPVTDVLNGLTVQGYLTFEIPANFKSYSLIYKPETGSYNVRYSNEGFTTATASAITLGTWGARDWKNPSVSFCRFVCVRTIDTTHTFLLNYRYFAGL
jgi:hypothetical protein